MKKLIGIAVILATVIGVLTITPMVAAGEVRKVYEADIIVLPTGECVGEAWIDEEGNIKVEIEGAQTLTKYTIKLMKVTPDGLTPHIIRARQTDEDGNLLLEDQLKSGVQLRQTTFAIFLGPNKKFASGFTVP